MEPFFQEKTQNSMEITMLNLKNRPLCAVSLFLHLDPSLEPEGLFGINHFLEHILADGAGLWRGTDAFFKHLAKHSIHFNASTYKQFMELYMLTVPESLSEALSILGNIITAPRFTKESVQKTKRIIIEEIQERKNKKGEWADTWILNERIFWQNTLFTRPVLGEIETVKKIEVGDLKRHHKKIVSATNLSVFVATNKKMTAVKNLVEKNFSSIKTGRKRKFYAPTLSNEGPRYIFVKNDTAHIDVSLRFPTVGIENDKFLHAEILNSIFGSSDYSRLFLEIREREGLVYRVDSTIYSYYGRSFIDIYFSAQPGNITTILEKICTIICSFLEKEVGSGELIIAKKRNYFSYLREVDSISSLSNFYGQEAFFGVYESLEERKKRVEKITKKDIQKSAQEIFTQKNLTLAAVGNISTKLGKDIQNLVKKFSA